MWVENVRADGSSIELDLRGSTSMANALRRSLLQDLEMWACDRVTFRANTSCQPDEYIAHRLGLIPFHQDALGNGEVSLHVKDRSAHTSDLEGSWAVVHDQEILKMIGGQELDCTLHMAKRKGSDHARFCPVAGVGYEVLEEGRVRLGFESISGQCPVHLLRLAILHLERRVDRLQELR